MDNERIKAGRDVALHSIPTTATTHSISTCDTDEHQEHAIFQTRPVRGRGGRSGRLCGTACRVDVGSRCSAVSPMLPVSHLKSKCWHRLRLATHPDQESAIDRMPQELWAEIFEIAMAFPQNSVWERMVVPMKRKLAIRHVCRSWRVSESLGSSSCPCSLSILAACL